MTDSIKVTSKEVTTKINTYWFHPETIRTALLEQARKDFGKIPPGYQMWDFGTIDEGSLYITLEVRTEETT